MALRTDLNNSDTLVIAATGYRNKLNMPVDEFFQAAGLEDASKIIISDPSFMKTLAGLPPDFPCFKDLVAYLKDLIAKGNYSNLYVTGTSGGGHTALLLGHLLHADKVVAFAPYPYLSIEEGRRMKDPASYSMARIIRKFDELPQESKQYLDLRDILLKWNGKTEYFVHVSRLNINDYRRAMYLAGLPNMHVVSHPYKKHAIAAILQREKQLKGCFSFPYQYRKTYVKVYLYLRFFFENSVNYVSRLVRNHAGRIKSYAAVFKKIKNPK